MNYSSRLDMVNGAIESANKHAKNIADIVNTGGTSKQQLATGIINSVGGAVGSTAGIVSGVQHFKDIKNMGQNIFNRMNGQVNTTKGMVNSASTGASGGGNDAGGVNQEGQHTGNINNTSTANNNADNLGGGNAPRTAGDATQNTPASARTGINEPQATNANPADADIDGMSWDDLVGHAKSNMGQSGTSQLGDQTDALVNHLGLGTMDSADVPSGAGSIQGQTDALNQITGRIQGQPSGQQLQDISQISPSRGNIPADGADAQNMAANMGDATNTTLDASHIATASGGAGGGSSAPATTAGNLVNRATSGAEEGLTAATDTAAAIGDTGDAIMAGSAASGVAAPLVAVVGGLVSLGATIASAFEKPKKTTTTPTPVISSNQNQGSQMGGNLRQDQGDSGVGLY